MKRNTPELDTKYAVLRRPTKLQTYVSEDVLRSSDGTPDFDSFVCDGGELLKVLVKPYKADLGDKFVIVQVLDFVEKKAMYENLYICPKAELIKVTEGLWPFVISIADPKRRISFVKNNEQQTFVFSLKINDFVCVPGDLFQNSGVRYNCIIRYIGPVDELNPVGYFFGLELLDLNTGDSPQANQIPFARNYVRCDPSLAIFTTADWISQLPSDVKKNHSTCDLLTGTIDKVITALNPNSNTSTTNSLPRKRKEKKKEANSRFYCDPGPSTVEQPKDDLVKIDTTATATAIEMDRKIAQHSNSTVTEADTPASEFKQSVENSEKNNECQYMSTGTQAGHIPVGILKHNRASTATNDSSIIKPRSAISVQERDIVVIGEDEIRDSMKSQSSVLLIENPKELDLYHVIRGDWPNDAGPVAGILNKSLLNSNPGSGGSSNSSVSSATQVRQERNKSSNPLSHIAATHVAEASNFQTHKNSTLHGAADNNNLDAAGRRSNVQRSAPEFLPDSPLQEVPGSGLGVGSMVEVSLPEETKPLYGVIRWIGEPPNTKGLRVGVELEREPEDKKVFMTDGALDGVTLFKCREGRPLIVTPDLCQSDSRFTDVDGATGGKALVDLHADSTMFGQVECPSVPGAVAPLKVRDLNALEEICGKFKGIQGHHNSCYLDATLFAMFTFTSVFDSLLFRPPESEDIPHYAEVQKVLREEIVNPLRKNLYVRADRVMKLRELLDQLSSVSGLTSEEKDPEEFLNSLLAQIMRVEPFLKLSSGQDAYYYQLFVEKDERLSFPSVQQLFEQSFYASDIKLKEVPSCLIIQMPRFGKNYKMYPRILPSQVLDVTDIIEDSPRQCISCGEPAEYECRNCFGNCFGSTVLGSAGLVNTAFCENCVECVHKHEKRSNHSYKKLSVPQDFRIMAEHMAVPRLYMELFAVVCIETSHYVAFVKSGSGPDAPWCFFDSMADRKGEKNGYNIPEMLTVPDLPLWLSDEGARVVNETSPNDKMLPEHAKRLFCDAYMCMYQSTDVMMYR